MKIISIVFLIFCLLAMSYLVVGLGTIVKNGTSITDKPGVLPRLKLFFTTNTAATSEQSVFPELQTRHYPLENGTNLLSFRQQVTKTAKSLGYTLEQNTSNDKALHFTITTKLFKFVDDLKITIEEDSSHNQLILIVNADSSSRTGRADFGANIANITNFFDSLDQPKR